MLAITIMPLLMVAIPLASASPFTFQAKQIQPKRMLLAATINSQSNITITYPATTARATAIPTAATKLPKETRPNELRAISPAPEPRDDGFAASIATGATAAAAAAAVATTANAIAEQAQTTATPSDDPEVDSELASDGYSQTTYYSCEAFAATTHCGWHVPVVYVGAAWTLRAAGGAAAMWAVGVGFLLGW